MKKSILAFLVMGASLALFIRIVSFPPEWWDLLLPPGTGTFLPVLVKNGMDAGQAAEKFAAAGVIEKDRDHELARWMVRFSIDRRLQPGVYMVKKGTPWEVARQLERTKPSFATATIVPGSDVYSFPEVFEPSLSEKEMNALVSSNEFFPKEIADLLPDSVEGRLAFLLPETMHIAEKTGREVISAAARLWWERLGPRIPPEKRTKKCLLEMAILASLIEREALWDDERSLIAGVIENRRERKMLLQVDASVVYAWKREGRNLTRVLYKDLEIDSPYNTYKIPGLPPDPICIPSEQSWLAAMSPEKTDFLYYVAQADGRHLFASTYKKHLRNIQKVRGQ